ncbi:small secreted protein [Streptomyces boninensis]|uniref:small secreted protein n=1 Tax=Streptomyces boninensis TaxID=2039455 RepID=UPI003B21FE05
MSHGKDAPVPIGRCFSKKLSAPLAAGAVVVLALTGCGKDNGDDAKAKDWAGTVCDKVQPQLKAIQSANADITKAAEEKDPAKVQSAYKTSFDKIAKAYAAMGDAVEGAGAPPIDDGKNTQTGAVKELRDTAKAYNAVKTTVEKLDTSDQGDFGEGLKDVAGELEKLNKTGDHALGKLQSGRLGQAMSEQAGCQKPESVPSKAA